MIVKLYRNTLLIGTIFLLCSVSVTRAQVKLGLNDAIRQALANNSAVAAASAEVNAARFGLRGAKALTNPLVVLTPTIIGDPTFNNDITIAQALEVNGIRKARTRVAKGDLAVATYKLDVTKNDLIHSVKNAYWQVALEEAEVDLAKENAAFAESIRPATNDQTGSCNATSPQSIRMEFNLIQARQSLTKLQSGLITAKANLNTLLGGDPAAPIETADKLVYIPLSINTDQLYVLARANRPEIKEAEANVATRYAAIDAIRATRRPDLALQAMKERFFSGTAGIDLYIRFPLTDWGSIKAGQRRAESLLLAEEFRAASVRNSVTLSVKNAVTSYQQADKLVMDYQSCILKESQQLLDTAQKSYTAGSMSYPDLMEALRVHQDVRSGYYEALAALWTARADLEWAIASDFAAFNCISDNGINGQ